MTTRAPSRDPLAYLTQLANRAAALAFASAFAVIVTLVAVPGALRDGELGRGVAALASLVITLGLVIGAWRARAQLHRARRGLESSTGSPSSAPELELPARATGSPAPAVRSSPSRDSRSRQRTA